MSRLVKCDSCGKTKQIDTIGWISGEFSDDGEEWVSVEGEDEADFCSFVCLATWAVSKSADKGFTAMGEGSA